MSRVADMVRDKTVTFQYYRDHSLWYKTECGFLFGVPIEECGTATFNATERAITLLGWIREQIDSNEEAKP